MIELNLTYTEKNLLDNLLFTASKSEQFKKSRKTSRLVFGVIVLLLTLFLFKYDTLIAGLVFGISVIVFIMFPQYLKIYYKKHFTKVAKSNENQRFIGREYHIGFYDYYLVSKSVIAEAKYLYSGFGSIHETRAYFFIKLDTPIFLLFPKDQIDNIHELRNYFKEICSKYKIPFLDEKNWTWK